MKSAFLPHQPFTAEWFRNRFSAAPASDVLHEEGIPPGPLTPAAVLVPIVLRDTEPTVLLTRRTDHLHHHPGQVSFPGGRVEEHDKSPIETALRETEEEISLHRKHVELLGCLPLYRTITCFEVTPVVGLVTHLSNWHWTPSKLLTHSRFRYPFFWIRQTISGIPSKCAERRGNTTRCLTATTLFGARRPA